MANPDAILPLKKPQVGALLGVNENTITKWEREGLPIAEAGGRGRATLYDASQVVAWYVAHEVRRVAGATNGALNPISERARKDKARADLDEQQLGIRNNALIPRSDFQRVLGKVVTEIRAKLLAAPRAWAVALAKAALGGPSAVETFLTARIREVLEALANISIDEEKAG